MSITGIKKKNGNPCIYWIPVLFSGDGGSRTHDLLNAIQALSQLSYAPVFSRLVPPTFIFYCIAA